MHFAVGVLIGLVSGAYLVMLSGKAAVAPGVSSTGPVWPPWTSLGLGVAAAGALVAGVAGALDSALAIIPVIAVQFAALVFGVGRLVLRDTRWQSWVGAGLALIPVLFWVVFVIAEIVGPPH